MRQIIREHSEAFAVVDAELTQTDLVVHEIDTENHMPIRQKERPVPMGTRKEFKGLIKGLVEHGILEKSSSEWAFPVVLVRIKDGTIRLCVDYRQLNKVTKQDSYPLPFIDMVLQSLSGKKVFSTLDMASGYLPIRLSEDAKKKSAFTTSEGLFQFVVLAFGLCTSPAVFKRMMDKVQDELKVKDDEIFVYIDDILVATETIERHFEVVKMVLEALQKASLRLKPQKCEFMKSQVNFLGHVIDGNGIHADPDKIRKNSEYPAPSNISELRTFLVMASYFRKFMMNLSKIAKPLYDLTSTKAAWK
ncbi:hypothetical protein Y032_0397g710 [Ancylostoma ceylanicum]|uniref:Reverse transcriptase domain-containing protein n=1 Tax=Ancylostoma ceylanicum TaxID=53326 RepID=A0A016RRJ4_9BILA|nr:hypothetical protein Y032_0397g710 [Ancylostoma ceylanicum]